MMMSPGRLRWIRWLVRRAGVRSESVDLKRQLNGWDVEPQWRPATDASTPCMNAVADDPSGSQSVHR
jgi:hypothetical protein